jgi:hypothetical protein
MKQHQRTVSPGLQRLPPGIPISTFIYAFKFVQAPQEIVMITDTGDPPRQIISMAASGPKIPTRSG